MQHERASSSHYVCEECNIDFWTADQLDDVNNPSLVLRLFADRFLPQHDAEEHSRDDDSEDDDDNDDEGYESDDEEGEWCFGCEQEVISFAAMLGHLESGNCSCKISCDMVNLLALRCPSSNRYVVRGREEFLRRGQSYRRARQSHYNPRTQYYECPWCNYSGASLYDLDMHLMSPVHDVKAFICPDPDCRQLFVNLSGLVAHVESDNCEDEIFGGIGSIEDLYDYFDEKLSS